MHADSANAGAIFQVASQFNLLEMVSDNVTPEQGVTRYERDATQGPACAIAAGAGTIYDGAGGEKSVGSCRTLSELETQSAGHIS